MNILLTADPFIPVPPLYYGGVERIVAGLVGNLRKRGHKVGLVAHPNSAILVDYFLGWPQVNPKGPVAHFQHTQSLSAAVSAFKPEVIHSFSRLLYLAPFLLGGPPKIMSYQRATGGAQTRIAAMLGGRGMRFTGCSSYIANMGRAFGGVWDGIPNFVDTSRLDFVPNVAADAPLVFLSRIEPIKGAHIAIEVAKRTGRRLLIAGNYAETGEEGRYWTDVVKPQLGHNGIEYVGTVDDAQKSRLLGDASAMLVPIQWDEPFGIVFAESLACGTPVIACPRGALPEIVREGVDGFLTRSVEEACDAVGKIPGIDRHACRQRVEQCFNTDAVVDQYEALYHSFH